MYASRLTKQQHQSGLFLLARVGGIQQHQMFGIVIPVFDFDVLIERPLRAVGLVTFIDVARVVSSYLHRSPSHPFPLLLLPRLSMPRVAATVVPTGLWTLETQLIREESDLALEELDLNAGRVTCAVLVRTSWWSLAAYRQKASWGDSAECLQNTSSNSFRSTACREAGGGVWRGGGESGRFSLITYQIWFVLLLKICTIIIQQLNFIIIFKQAGQQRRKEDGGERAIKCF